MTKSFLAPLEGLIAGHLSVDQVYALALDNLEGAHPKLLARLQENARNLPPGKGEWGQNLLEIVWRLDGTSRCIREHFVNVNDGAAQIFFMEKLTAGPAAFSDDDLYALRNGRLAPVLTPLLVKIQSERLAPIANTLLANPRELSTDVKEVQRYVSSYRFNPDLNELLDKVEQELRSGGDAFDQSATLKHLRTFYEKLHEQVSNKLREEKPETKDGTDLSKCGQAIDFLHRKNVLTQKMKDLAKALYGVLSNEGVHAIKSDREYVRLCRNMVAEYALVLFFELQRRLE